MLYQHYRVHYSDLSTRELLIRQDIEGAGCGEAARGILRTPYRHLEPLGLVDFRGEHAVWPDAFFMEAV